MAVRHILRLTLPALGLVGLTACGGGGSSPAPATPTPPPVSPAPPPAVPASPDLTQDRLLTDAELETTALNPVPSVATIYSDWLVDNHHTIRSVTYDQDFSDLAFLPSLIGDRALVQLGESSHGTAEFNHAKVRLIKYLHQEMGFSVIALESGFFEGVHADSLREIGSPQGMMGFLFGVWNTEEVLELFDYVQETQAGPNPLRIAGFDVQISSNYYSQIERFIRDIPTTDDLTEAFKDELIRDTLQMRSLQTDFYNQGCFETHSAPCDTIVETLGIVNTRLIDLRNRVAALPDRSREIDIVRITLIAASGQIDYLRSQYTDGTNASSNVRDLGMADLVTELRDTLFPGEKMIIWAHNRHIAHEQSPTLVTRGTIFGIAEPMGFHLKARYPDDLFSIGLYMLRGQTANNFGESLNVAAPIDDSLEAIAHSVRKAAIYIDSRPDQPQVAGNQFLFERTGAHYWGGTFGSYSMIPTDQFDGLLIIDQSSTPDYR